MGVMLVYHDFRGDIASQIGTHTCAEMKQPGCARQDIVLLPRSNAGWVFVGCKRVSF